MRISSRLTIKSALLLTLATVAFYAHQPEAHGQTTFYAQELVDAGDDPFHPGCALVFTDAACTSILQDEGEVCANGSTLREVTNAQQDCAALAVRLEDCMALCNAKGWVFGVCVADVGFCPGGLDGGNSAHCFCHNPA